MSDSTGHSTNPFFQFLNSISSSDGNVLLAAVISLLLVILFVLLLHVYAKCFLSQRSTSSSSSYSSPSVSHVFRHDRFHRFHAFMFDTNFPSKGLDSSAISSIPLFVYKMEEDRHGLECVICLTAFEDQDVGRKLPKCGHGFHVECIDMWLHSHSNCPICRAPVILGSVLTSPDDSEATSLEVESVRELLNGERGMLDVSDSNNSLSGDANDDNLSASSSSSLTLSSSLACSLKRMLSRNRSERKVFPSSNTSEVEV